MRTMSGRFNLWKWKMSIKELTSALTIQEQIDNLRSLGLCIENEADAKRVLNEVSYFRLIKAYSLGLKPKNGDYYDNVSFETIYGLYEFNMLFRQLIFTVVEQIEVNLRCRIGNYFCLKYGVMGYENPENFINSEYHTQFLNDIHQEIERNSKSPFVRNYNENYDGKIPMYAAVELFSFGTLSKFFKNMKNSDKKEIALLYGVKYTYLESWFENIAYVRNICAHYGRIYKAKFTKRPMMYKQDIEKGIDNSRMFSVMICISRLIKRDDRWLDVLDQIELLLEKYPMVDLSAMGFPPCWKELLE